MSASRIGYAPLEELRLATLEDLFDARLATGHHSGLVADLEQLVEANPLRERLRAQLMLALYRSGRQADALEMYQRGRRRLVDELGLEPSESLRKLEARILQHDPALERPSAVPRAAEKPPPGSRRTTTRRAALAILFVGVVAAALIAATSGHGRKDAGAPLVTLVVDEPRSDSIKDTSTQGIDPIDGLRAAAQEVNIRTRILYPGPSPASFLRTVAAAGRTSDFVIVEATFQLEALSK